MFWPVENVFQTLCSPTMYMPVKDCLALAAWNCFLNEQSDLEEFEEVMEGHILAGKVRASCLI